MPRALPRLRMSVRLHVGDRIMVRPTSRHPDHGMFAAVVRVVSGV